MKELLIRESTKTWNISAVKNSLKMISERKSGSSRLVKAILFAKNLIRLVLF